MSGTVGFDSYSVDEENNSFDIVARDFGGLSGEPNITTQHLELYISDRPTELVTTD